MKKGRKPSDYPQFSFRISAEDKGVLQKEIEEITNKLNDQLDDGEYLYRKNDITLKAIKIGLKKLKINLK